MAGDNKAKYAAFVALTVTNLHSLASDQSLLAGWSSAVVDNTSNLYLDYLLSMSFTTHASNRQAGKINIYVIASYDDTPNWPAANSGTWGTEGAASFVDTEERDSIARPVWSIDVDNSASAVYGFQQLPLFGGLMVPSHFCLFVTQNCSTTTTAGLAASGSKAGYKPGLLQYT